MQNNETHFFKSQWKDQNGRLESRREKLPAGRSGASTEKTAQAGGGNCDKKDKRHTEYVSEDVKGGWWREDIWSA